MGVVHLARDRRTGDRVALKMLRTHIVGDEEARQRLAREVNSLSRITSPWVAEIVDADPWAEIPYVATRYVPGLSLHDHVHDEGPIEGTDLLWFAACLAEGLAGVHDVGVLHRDVKPSNVLMEGRTPILIDFGLARVADDPRLTHTGWLLGTPGYLAPEILYGENATPAADVHSWASTVAYAGLGRGPFGRGPSMAIMDRVRRGEHDLGDIESPLRDVLAAALDTDPLRRPTLAELLAWLRPQTTRPSPVVTAPPLAEEQDDDFTLPLALAAMGTAPPGAPGPAPAPISERGPAGTRFLAEPTVDPASPSGRAADPSGWDYWDGAAPTIGVPLIGGTHDPDLLRAPGPLAPTPVEPIAPRVRPERRPQPRPAPAPAPAPYEQAYPETYDPGYPVPHDASYDSPWEHQPPPPRASAGERLRQSVLVVAGALVLGVACAAAPWLALGLITVAVWLLRSGSLAASAVGERRLRRGTRWYDAPQLLLSSPWHLVRSIPGTAMLWLWSAGLAIAAGLLCYAVALDLTRSLFGCGVVFALSLWWGPGGGRVRSPLLRVVGPASARGAWWLGSLVLLGILACGLALQVAQHGISWTPAGARPLASASSLPGR